MPLNSRAELLERIERGPEARAKLVDSHVSKTLAFQLRALRDAEEWSQAELAERADMPQTAVSRLESPKYGKATLTTLKRLAAVFDVALVVRFVPFSELIDWISGTPRVEHGLSSASIQPPKFACDYALYIPQEVLASKKLSASEGAIDASRGRKGLPQNDVMAQIERGAQELKDQSEATVPGAILQGGIYRAALGGAAS
jgi:transcriptional regulator with XRE-family HTH domain